MRKLLTWIWQALVAFAKDVAEDVATIPRPVSHRPIPKDMIEKRLAEIATGRCPRCRARLFVSHGMQYLACENQYDPQRTLELAGSGNCSRMITSLEILRAECKRHGLEMPVL
jgi:hypothetical protein